MAARYLLDTNICIYIRQKRPPQLQARFEKLQAGEAAISVVTYGELLYGAARSSQPDMALARLTELASFLPVLPLPDDAAVEYGRLRADLEKRGEVIGGNDLWIAAHARAAGLVLVTNNEREFKRVSGLKLQNWTT